MKEKQNDFSAINGFALFVKSDNSSKNAFA
jgi:hypothetical protein